MNSQEYYDYHLKRARRAIAWFRAFQECLLDRRPVSILKTYYQLEGLLI